MISAGATTRPFFYAIESSYGTPDQLKELVDTAHQHGTGVILDVVMNHGGSGDNVLWQVGQDDIKRWLGLSEQRLGLDKWNVCRVQAAAICGMPLK